MLDTRTMRPLTGELLLAAWESGTPAHDLDRALTMLATALPDADREQLAAVPIAELNALLLRLHELTFGPLLNVFGVCARCGAQFEFAVPTAEMAPREFPASEVAWRDKGRHYRLRAVTADDLLATLGVPEVSAAQDLLLARCLEVSLEISLEVSRATGPNATSSAVRRRFEQLNMAGELSCTVDCPECSSRDLLDLDMARFLWKEVRNAARRLFGEIHQLASVYGWSERDIAEMGPARRAAYLEMLST